MDRECRRCHTHHPYDRFHRSTGHICRRCRTTYEVARRRDLRFAPLPAEPDSNPSDASLPDDLELGASRHEDCNECGASDNSSGDELEEEDDPAPLGSLYVMENSRIPSELKVGRSRNPFRRALQLARSHNFEMKLVAIFPEAGCVEAIVHSMLRKDRVPGRSREFFKISRKRAFSAISIAMGSFD